MTMKIKWIGKYDGKIFLLLMSEQVQKNCRK